jgi:hypothetical protein
MEEQTVASITLPCGCRINEAFVLGMCLTHDVELRQKKREDEEAFEKYERLMRSALSASEGRGA